MEIYDQDRPCISFNDSVGSGILRETRQAVIDLPHCATDLNTIMAILLLHSYGILITSCNYFHKQERVNLVKKKIKNKKIKAFPILDPRAAEMESRILKFVLYMNKHLINCLLEKVSF